MIALVALLYLVFTYESSCLQVLSVGSKLAHSARRLIISCELCTGFNLVLRVKGELHWIHGGFVDDNTAPVCGCLPFIYLWKLL